MKIPAALGRAATVAAVTLPVIVRDAVGVAGVASISYGAWLAWHPAGFIIGGAMLALGAWLLGRKDG